MKRGRVLSLAIVLLALFLASSCTKGTIMGKVTDDFTGDPIEGATVAYDKASTTTNEFGDYTFTEVEAGIYTVNASMAGYEADDQEVDVAESAVVVANFALEPQSPYPGLEITGTINDLRGGGVEGVQVRICNVYDCGYGDTNVDGDFTLIVDGSDSASSLRLRHDTYREYSGSAGVLTASADIGTRSFMSKEEVLFSAWNNGEMNGDIFMVRADGVGDLVQLTDTLGVNEVTPCRNPDGLVVRWADTSGGTVHEASWNGSGAGVVHTVEAGYNLTGMAWGDRGIYAWGDEGTFISRYDTVEGTNDIIIAEDPPGGDIWYDWPGQYPDESPPSFGSIGPYDIHGNMLCFAGAVESAREKVYGLFTAFPYFSANYYDPDHIAWSDGSELYPRWSEHRADGSLDIGFQEGYTIYVTHVTSDETSNHYSNPVTVYGDAANDINVNRIAWAPEIEGVYDRIAFTVNAFSSGSTLAEPGDIVVLTYDHTTSSVVGMPTVIYDANAPESPGKAISVDWR